MMENAMPNIFFPPPYSPEKVRFPGTIWKQNGNSLQYVKGFCNKIEFLSAKKYNQSISLKVFKRDLSFENLLIMVGTNLPKQIFTL